MKTAMKGKMPKVRSIPLIEGKEMKETHWSKVNISTQKGGMFYLPLVVSDTTSAGKGSHSAKE